MSDEIIDAERNHKPTSLTRAERTEFTTDQVGLIKRTIAKGASDDELALFLNQCRRTGLDPFSRQIYLLQRWDSKQNRNIATIQVGIDGYRLIADRTGSYAGNDDPVFDDEASPARATVTVWKLVGGTRCPFTATARWAQYYPGDKQGFMWRKMPHLMLGKVAEALALRKAFPAELSGLYITEEMEQAGGAPIQPEPDRPEAEHYEPAPQPAPKPNNAAALEAVRQAKDAAKLCGALTAQAWDALRAEFLPDGASGLDMLSAGELQRLAKRLQALAADRPVQKEEAPEYSEVPF